ncbi:hypothetical protein AU197_13890 [Mycobacterium sp. IS-1590]|uniref:hypothetical protein n=1 Tax=Mycobacterium sp. IS-1590 TaxID=1772286 RepID=UPI000746DBCD|nr:hypothetical protein [Mycobacterium sp. IS-1590]KUI45420.1 hypothetical protein AU197_13890 [Mycobacterium sp. IS-1590]
MRTRGPLITLGAVAALAAALWLGNASQEPAPAAAPATESATTPSAPAPATAPQPPATGFPARADYVGTVPTAIGPITLEISVDGDQAIAYACDGDSVEMWLRGDATDGVVNLTSRDKTGVLDGHLDGDAVMGLLTIGEKSWVFTAPAAEAPAGLFVYERDGVRSSWIVDEDGDVTGVLRRNDGSIGPAPVLATDGTAVIDGQRVRAVRVGGGSDV